MTWHGINNNDNSDFVREPQSKLLSIIYVVLWLSLGAGCDQNNNEKSMDNESIILSFSFSPSPDDARLVRSTRAQTLGPQSICDVCDGRLATQHLSKQTDIMISILHWSRCRCRRPRRQCVQRYRSIYILFGCYCCRCRRCCCCCCILSTLWVDGLCWLPIKRWKKIIYAKRDEWQNGGMFCGEFIAIFACGNSVLPVVSSGRVCVCVRNCDRETQPQRTNDTIRGTSTDDEYRVSNVECRVVQEIIVINGVSRIYYYYWHIMHRHSSLQAKIQAYQPISFVIQTHHHARVWRSVALIASARTTHRTNFIVHIICIRSDTFRARNTRTKRNKTVKCITDIDVAHNNHNNPWCIPIRSEIII